MMDNFLKECPFCGGVGELKKSNICGGHGFYLTTAFVECVECGARSGAVDDYNGELDLCGAMNNWNTRKYSRSCKYK